MEREAIKCPMCNKWHAIELSAEQYEKLYDYRHGYGTIQEQFPELNRVEREFLKSGYCPSCQEMLFGNGKTEKVVRDKSLDRY